LINLTGGLELPQEVKPIGGLCMLAVNDKGHHKAKQNHHCEITVPQHLTPVPANTRLLM